jgi:hypothetical protein
VLLPNSPKTTTADFYSTMDAPDGKLDTLLIQCVVPSQHVLQQRGSLMSQPISLPVERVTDSLWNDSMTPEDFQKFYPLLIDWLRTTLATYAGRTQTVASRAFPRLPLYFTAETLASAKVVLVDQLPVPPLSSMGLTQFADFERGNFNGITYLDTFFLKRSQSENEAIHFHELIHVIQWRILGPERFLRSYADGLERFGYRESPLEVMAYDAEAAFVTSKQGFDAENMVAEKLT